MREVLAVNEQITLGAIDNPKRPETWEIVERFQQECWIAESRTVGRGKNLQEITEYRPFRFTVTRIRRG